MERQQRSNVRAPFQGWVEVTARGQRRLGTGRDLSPSGIGLAIPGDALAAGAVVTSEFALPGISLPLALDGHVVWHDTRGGRLGIRFERVDPGLTELIESFVAGRL